MSLLPGPEAAVRGPRGIGSFSLGVHSQFLQHLGLWREHSSSPWVGHRIPGQDRTFIYNVSALVKGAWRTHLSWASGTWGWGWRSCPLRPVTPGGHWSLELWPSTKSVDPVCLPPRRELWEYIFPYHFLPTSSLLFVTYCRTQMGVRGSGSLLMGPHGQPPAAQSRVKTRRERI